MKTKKGFIALMIWAIDVDALSLSIEKCWEMFQRDAWAMYRTYTDPSDKLLYCPNCVRKNPLDFMIEYVIFYAKAHVQSGTRSYGKYNKDILTL